MVTHDAAAAAQADRVVFLRDGLIVSEVAGADAAHVAEELHSLTLPQPEGAAR
jgi:putative ABC transport system ATP-binding protein